MLPKLLILLEWLLSFSELSSSSDEDLGGLELEYSSLSVFEVDKNSFSFCLPLDFLEGLLSFSFFVLKKLWKHLLKGVDRLLLSSNHIELFPLD